MPNGAASPFLTDQPESWMTESHRQPPHREPHPPRGPLALVYRWLFDFEHREGFAARLDYLIAVLIILSVLSIILEHIEAIYTPYAQWFDLLDWVLIGIFTLEYMLRLATAPLDPEFAGSRFPRLRYIFSFYALVDLLAIAPAYIAGFMALNADETRILRLLRLMRVFKLSRHLVPAWQEFQSLNRHRSFRARLYALLEPTGHSGRLHAYVDNFVIFWVLLSIVSVILRSVDSLAELFPVEFLIIDTLAFAVFSVEYLARLYTAPERPELKAIRWKRLIYARSPGAIIDLLAVLPTLIEALVPNDLDLRFLRVFRLMRLLKLTRYTSAAVTLYKVISRERQIIVAAGFVMLLLVVLTASMGYLFEHDAQPDKFENIPQSIYWAVVTLASVGYGDISPVTPMGRALTVVLALIGIGIFAIPAGLLASAFSDQLRIDREDFKRRLVHAYEGGESAAQARELIAAEAERLHLSRDDVTRLTREAKAEFEDRRRESHEAGRVVMIDPVKHPDLVASQFVLGVSQLQMLLHAAGLEALRRPIHQKGVDAALAAEVLELIASRASGDSRQR